MTNQTQGLRKGLSKHHTAGHDVAFNPNGGTYHCITCGHPILRYEQEAAPELLEALKDLLVDYLDNPCVVNDGWLECGVSGQLTQDALNKAKQAIAKAEGNQ